MDSATASGPPRRYRKWIIGVLVGWQLLYSSLLIVAGQQNARLLAVAKMLWGLNLLWIIGFGWISLAMRPRVADWGHRFPRWAPAICFGIAVVLALIEEAITTAMTNCAPLFGVAMGEAYLTASANYLDVVLLHSVVVFLPQFALLAVLLARYALTPFAAMMCYGLTGFCNEALFGGLNLLMLPQWILVYGLFIFLPACIYDHHAHRRRVPWWLWPVAIFGPILAAIPMVLLLQYVIAPGHPSIHFPPLGPVE